MTTNGVADEPLSCEDPLADRIRDSRLSGLVAVGLTRRNKPIHWSGSGVAVGRHHVLTARHVLNEKGRGVVVVRQHGREPILIEGVEYFEKEDIALLFLDRPLDNIMPLVVGMTRVIPQEKATFSVHGFPGTWEGMRARRTDLDSRPFEDGAFVPNEPFDLPGGVVHPGYSGGPLCVSRQQLTGMFALATHGGLGSPSSSFFPIDRLLTFLCEQGVRPQIVGWPTNSQDADLFVTYQRALDRWIDRLSLSGKDSVITLRLRGRKRTRVCRERFTLVVPPPCAESDVMEQTVSVPFFIQVRPFPSTLLPPAIACHTTKFVSGRTWHEGMKIASFVAKDSAVAVRLPSALEWQTALHQAQAISRVKFVTGSCYEHFFDRGGHPEHTRAWVLANPLADDSPQKIDLGVNERFEQATFRLCLPLEAALTARSRLNWKCDDERH